MSDDRAAPNVRWYVTARAKHVSEAVLRRYIKISLCLIRLYAIAMFRASGGRVGACLPNPNPIERSRRHCVATAPVIEREDYVISDISLADYGSREIDIAETDMPGLDRQHDV